MHQHVESFGGAVDRGGQACRARADDHDIADVVLIDVLVETETVRNLLIVWIAQEATAATDQHRNVADGEVKAIEHLLHVGVPVEVEVLEGVSVAGQELLHSKRRRGMRRADEHDVTNPLRRELHAAIDEGSHQELADLGVGLHDAQQLFASHLDHFARLAGSRAHQGAPPEDHVGFASELTRAVDRHQRVPRVRGADDLDLAGDDHEERHRGIARLDQDISAHDRTHDAVRGDSRNLRRRQRRENERRARGAHERCHTSGRHVLLPDAERAADGDELADVIRGVIRDEEDGAQVGLVAFARGHGRRQILHVSRQVLHPVARASERGDARLPRRIVGRRVAWASSRPAMSWCARSWR